MEGEVEARTAPWTGKMLGATFKKKKKRGKRARKCKKKPGTMAKEKNRRELKKGRQRGRVKKGRMGFSPKFRGEGRFDTLNKGCPIRRGGK